MVRRIRVAACVSLLSHGSHIVFSKNGRTVIVANHRGDVPTGTLRAICRQAGWEYPPKR